MLRPNVDQRKTEILEAAVQVIIDVGFTEMTVADVAKVAGVSTALVHYHFSSKKEVVLAVVDDLAARLRARAREKAGKDPDAAARLHGFIDAAVGLGPGADAESVACWIGVSAEAVRDPEVREVTAKVTRALVDELATLTRAALLDRGRRTEEARKIAALLWSAMQGSYLLAVTSPGAVPRGAMAPMLHALADRFIGEQAADLDDGRKR